MFSLTYKFTWNMPFEDEILDLGAHNDDDNLEEEAMFYEVNKSCDYLRLFKIVSLVKRC